jgi:DNA-binding GntR family transcriptional regulator
VILVARSPAVQVYEALRQRITEERMPGGEGLSLAALAKEFSVSPTPVREALARLHADGLAVLEENRGYRVAMGPSPRALVMDARVIIEVNTLRLAAGSIDQTTLRHLQSINDRISSGNFTGKFASLKAFADLNATFHSALVEAAGNPFLLRAWRQVALTAQFSRVHYRGGVRHRALIAVEHRRVLNRLRAQDVEGAAEALRRYIVDSLDRDLAHGAPPRPESAAKQLQNIVGRNDEL